MAVADDLDHPDAQGLDLAFRWGSIPRISHGKQHRTACGGTWLHGLQPSQGRRSVPELVFLVVAGVGFEPT